MCVGSRVTPKVSKTLNRDKICVNTLSHTGTKLLVQSGDAVHVYDLTRNGNKCTTLTYPNYVNDAAGGMIGRNPVPVVCGGWDTEAYAESKGCFEIGGERGVFAKMKKARYWHSALALPDKTLWIVGGNVHRDQAYVQDSSTEFIHEDGGTEWGPDLTYTFSDACSVLVNDSWALIIGGREMTLFTRGPDK